MLAHARAPNKQVHRRQRQRRSTVLSGPCNGRRSAGVRAPFCTSCRAESADSWFAHGPPQRQSTAQRAHRRRPPAALWRRDIVVAGNDTEAIGIDAAGRAFGPARAPCSLTNGPRHHDLSRLTRSGPGSCCKALRRRKHHRSSVAVAEQPSAVHRLARTQGGPGCRSSCCRATRATASSTRRSWQRCTPSCAAARPWPARRTWGTTAARRGPAATYSAWRSSARTPRRWCGRPARRAAAPRSRLSATRWVRAARAASGLWSKCAAHAGWVAAPVP